MRHILSIFVFTAILSNTFAQTSYEGVGMTASYSFSNDVKALDIGTGYIKFKKTGRSGWTFGVFGGPAWGVYGGELSNGNIVQAINDDMDGVVLDDYDIPEDTDGGFSIGTKLLFTYLITNYTFISIGPRLNYFSPQEISVYNESSDNSYIYYQYTQIPYKGNRFIPGVELDISVSGWWTANYAISLLPEGNYMHSLGFTRIIAF
jgi:hypothetical protein